MASGAPALAPEIEALRLEFERISSEADRLVAPLTDEQFTWRPGPAAWSVAECLEHLNATARSYLPALDEGIDDAIRRGAYADGPFDYGWLGRFVTHLIEPPPRFRVKAPRAVQPGPARPKRDTTAGFHAFQVQYMDRLRQANGIDLAHARVRSPVVAWIRIPLGSGFAAMAAHERRHLWQIRRITESTSWPPSQ